MCKSCERLTHGINHDDLSRSFKELVIDFVFKFNICASPPQWPTRTTEDPRGPAFTNAGQVSAFFKIKLIILTTGYDHSWPTLANAGPQGPMMTTKDLRGPAFANAGTVSFLLLNFYFYYLLRTQEANAGPRRPTRTTEDLRGPAFTSAGPVSFLLLIFYFYYLLRTQEANAGP
jgi:hypothetical protein